MDRIINSNDVKVKGRVSFWRKYKYFILIGAVALILGALVIKTVMAPSRMRYDRDNIVIAEVTAETFMEYTEIEGTAEPIQTVMITSDESGIVERIVALDGSVLSEGDTILVLKNPEMARLIEEKEDQLEKARITYEESILQMERRSSELRRTSMKTVFELEKLSRQYEIDKEEFKMGILSKAQLELSSENYDFQVNQTKLLLEEYRSDSLANIIQAELLRNNLRREEKSFEQAMERRNDLIVRATVTGQIGYIAVRQGERVAAGSPIGDIKVMDELKINVNVSEHYHGRIYADQPAVVITDGKRYPMKVSRVYPELRERAFGVDLVFDQERPANLLPGKTYRVQMELGNPEMAVTIPKGNFFRSTGGQWIFKLDASGNKAYRTDIVVGKNNPKQYEIIEGLQPGDKVIVTGYENFGDARQLILK